MWSSQRFIVLLMLSVGLFGIVSTAQAAQTPPTGMDLAGHTDRAVICWRRRLVLPHDIGVFDCGGTQRRIDLRVVIISAARHLQGQVAPLGPLDDRRQRRVATGHAQQRADDHAVTSAGAASMWLRKWPV